MAWRPYGASRSRMCLPLDAAGEFSCSTCDLLLESQARNEYRVRTVLTREQRCEPYVLGAGVAIVGALIRFRDIRGLSRRGSMRRPSS